MVPPQQNRLLPILVSLVFAPLLLVAFKSCRETARTPAILSTVPVAPAADADTPADTIKTLTANVAAMTSEVEALRQDNASLKRDNQALIGDRDQIEQHLKERLDETLATRAKTADLDQAEHTSALSTLTARVDALADSLSSVSAEHKESDIPVGLSLIHISEPTRPY